MDKEMENIMFKRIESCISYPEVKSLAYFMFREIIENAHAKYNISQEDMKAMTKQAVDRAGIYLALEPEDRRKLLINAINCMEWDDPDMNTEDSQKWLDFLFDED